MRLQIRNPLMEAHELKTGSSGLHYQPLTQTNLVVALRIQEADDRERSIWAGNPAYSQVNREPRAQLRVSQLRGQSRLS